MMNSHPTRPVQSEGEPPAKLRTKRLLTSDQSTNDVTDTPAPDFIIINAGKQYPVHKHILTKHSEYFKVLLEGATQMKETQTNQVHLQGLSEVAVKAVIRFIYDDVVDVSWPTLDELFDAASHLQIDSLATQLTLWINDHFAIEHYRTLQSINKYGLGDVLNTQIAKHFNEFTEHPDLYFELEADDLINIVSQDCLHVRSERKLLSCLEQWLEHSREAPRTTRMRNQEDIIVRLLSNVRFCLMSFNEIDALTLGASYPSFIKALIRSAYRYHQQFDSLTALSSTVQSRVRSTEPSFVLVLESGAKKGHEILACKRSDDENATQTYSLYVDAAHQKTCGVVTLDNRLYTVSLEHYGGFDSDSAVRLSCFDPCTCNQKVLPSPELQVIPAGITELDRKIYLCGGVSMELTDFVDRCEAYCVDTVSWQHIPSLPSPVNNCAAASLNGKVYLSGGQLQIPERTIIGDLLSYKPGDNEWVILSGMNVARRGHAMLPVNDEALMACGGLPIQVSGSQGPVVPLERYNVQSDQWTRIEGCTTLRGPSLGHFMLLPHEPNKLYTLGHELHRAQEHEIWCTNLDDSDAPSQNSKLYMSLPDKYKLHCSFAALLCLNFYDDKISTKRRK